MKVQLPETVADCHELIKRLVELTYALVLRVEQLEQENKALKERLDNNSSNSSKPPSQDFKKKPRRSPTRIREEELKDMKDTFESCCQ